ncbi:MAG: parallel beta-helix repeat protein [Planctomycetota bacterium]|jgi:parallel beta-helix repeat protein
MKLSIALAGILMAGLCWSCASGASARASQKVSEAVPEMPITALGPVLEVRGDTRVKPGEYQREARGSDGEAGVIVIEDQNNIVLDLTGVVMRGSALSTDTNSCRGYGIVIRRSNGVTIRGGRIGGYLGCIVIDNCRDVTLDGVEFEGWYSQRLLSTVSAPSSSDKLVRIPNDGRQWLADYGAAVSVIDSANVVVRDCSGRHGQNGVLLVRSDGCEVSDCDFSFLSGWGIALYQSSRNQIAHNILDYAVRGYSHDVYWKGLGAAGILLVERSSDNIISSNSATHCSSGIVVLGGKDLSEGHAFTRGELDSGGSDRNLMFQNDLRFAVGACMEWGFSSRNTAIANLLSGSHGQGVLARYCQLGVIADNVIEDVRGPGVSLLHSQDFLVVDNTLRNDQMGVEFGLTDNERYTEGAWGKHRDTTSRSHFVVGNQFDENDQDIVLKQSSQLVFQNNSYPAVNTRLYVNGLSVQDEESLDEQEALVLFHGEDGSQPSGHISGSEILRWDASVPPRLVEARRFTAPAAPGQQRAFKHAGSRLEGLSSIVSSEWGPWDFRGGEPRPSVRYAGGALAHASWDAVWFQWGEENDPRGEIDVWRARRFEHAERKTIGNFRNPWGEARVRQKVGMDRFGLIASTQVSLQAGGLYRLTVICDDGLRLSIDDDLVLDDWSWHSQAAQHVIELELTSGLHKLDLEYFQVDGSAALSIDLEQVDG